VYGLDRTDSGSGQVAGTCDCGHEMRGISSLAENWLVYNGKELSG